MKRDLDLVLLCDLNTKLQGQQELISDTFGAVRVLEIKLKLRVFQ